MKKDATKKHAMKKDASWELGEWVGIIVWVADQILVFKSPFIWRIWRNCKYTQPNDKMRDIINQLSEVESAAASLSEVTKTPLWYFMDNFKQSANKKI